MRELPLPGTPDSANNRRDFKHTKPAPRADNGLGSNKSDAFANDAARRGSGKEASTSSSGSVTFQPPQQSSLARTNGAAVRQTQRRSDNNSYDATIAVNQAAPGFTAASRSAAATTEQRAESLIDAGQSKLFACATSLACPHALEDSASQPRCTGEYHRAPAGMPAFFMDSDFRWSRDNYNNTQRSIDIWTFIVTLRTKLWLLDQKWSYVGGWTELKKTERLRSTASWTRYPCLHKRLCTYKLISLQHHAFPWSRPQSLDTMQPSVRYLESRFIVTSHLAVC